MDYSQTGFTSVNANLNYSGVSYTMAGGVTGAQTIWGIAGAIGTSGNDLLYASNVGSTLDGDGGNDSLFGGSGSDTFVFNHGYTGTTYINDTNASSNTLRLGGISFNNLWAGATLGANNMITLSLGERGTSGIVSIVNDFTFQSSVDVIKTLDMGGSGQVDISQITAVMQGSDNVDTLNGYYNTPNMILGYNGNDAINATSGVVSQLGSVIDGGLGNDTITTSTGDDQFLFDRGGGQDTIYDAGGSNTIVFGPSVQASDIIYQVVGNDIYVGIADPNNPTFTASQVADNMRLVGAAVQYQNQNTGAVSYNTTFIVDAGGATTDLT